MPFIESKLTVKITDQQKEEIKSELGKLISTLNKSETYLMVGIEDSCDLWLGGKEKLGIPGRAVYVTYHPVSDWGWNGQNF